MFRRLYPSTEKGWSESSAIAASSGTSGALTLAQEHEVAFGGKDLHGSLRKSIWNGGFNPGHRHLQLLRLPWRPGNDSHTRGPVSRKALWKAMASGPAAERSMPPHRPGSSGQVAQESGHRRIGAGLDRLSGRQISGVSNAHQMHGEMPLHRALGRTYGFRERSTEPVRAMAKARADPNLRNTRE